MVYNNRTPNTAIGTGLDALSASYGISKIAATYSSVYLTVSGLAGTVIPSGSKCQDTNGNNWVTNAEVTIPSSGTTAVSALSENKGNYKAQANIITKIVNPIYGWQSVTNASASTPGSDEESDSSLRSRCLKSVALPTRTVREGIESGLLTVAGVEKAIVYENDSSVVDSNGLPAKSISAVVIGGTDAEVASMIYLKKTPGCYTQGDVVVDVSSITGIENTIRFYRAAEYAVKLNVAITSLSGYSASSVDNIKAVLTEYFSSAEIGKAVYLSVLQSIIQSVSQSAIPEFAVTSVQWDAVGGSTWKTTNIAITFKQIAALLASNVTVTVS
jgi:uncharacterized phage protein gp47/JayE